MKLPIDIIVTLLSFCATGRTVAEMKNKLAVDHDPKLVQSLINYMMKQKLIIQEVRRGYKQPNTWIKNISLNHYAVKKAG